MDAAPRRPRGFLPPTSEDLYLDSTRPYFLWWSQATVGDLKEYLASPDPEVRAYWLGALLREANTRDVWVFTDREQIRDAWPRLLRYLGKSREMWAWLLELPPPEWPPREALEAAAAWRAGSPDTPDVGLGSGSVPHE